MNGHSWTKRQLEGRHIGYQPLDNGLAAVDDGRALQALCDSLSAQAIERFVRRWLKVLPSPLTDAHGDADYRYELSILQLEISCTEVFDRPLHGRQFFESVITDQLDLGRPEKLQLIFGHPILRHRAAAFRTRVFGAGANPSLHVEHRATSVKQYWKLGRALRTETTINDAERRAGSEQFVVPGRFPFSLTIGLSRTKGKPCLPGPPLLHPSWRP